MKMLFFASAAVSLLFPKLIISTPTELGIVKFNQKLLLCAVGERHYLLDDNKVYLNKMREVLTSNDAQKKREFVIMLEKADALVSNYRKPGSGPDLLMDLMSLCQELKLRKTTVHDIETRKFANAAQTLLDPEMNPFWQMGQKFNPEELYLRSAQEAFGCAMHEITFDHVIDELKTQLSQVTALKEKWNIERVQKWFNKKIAAMNADIEELESMLRTYNIQTTDSIVGHSFVLSLSAEENKKRFKLFMKISDVSCILFDLFLIDRILQLKDEPQKTIILIVGAEHIRNLYKAFRRTEIFEILQSHYDNSRKGLDAELLDLLKKPLSYFERPIVIVILTCIGEAIFKYLRGCVINTLDPQKRPTIDSIKGKLLIYLKMLGEAIDSQKRSKVLSINPSATHNL